MFVYRTIVLVRTLKCGTTHPRPEGAYAFILNHQHSRPRRPTTAEVDMLPFAFCWTKFGTEAGECPESILDRKEQERSRNDGVFLWGIGSSIRPSLGALLQLTEAPEVLFTPMLSPPASHDVAPQSLLLWRTASGIDGRQYEMPQHSLVTSRAGPTNAQNRHYALICRCDVALEAADDTTWIDRSEVRNLRTGTAVGSSQVTSVVSRVAATQPSGRRYKVAFRASLVYPYLAVLGDPAVLEDSMRLDRADGDERHTAMEEVRAIRVGARCPDLTGTCAPVGLHTQQGQS